MKGKRGKPAYLEKWTVSTSSLHAEEAELKVYFDWEKEIEEIGAIIIKNTHPSQFYLKTVTLTNVPMLPNIIGGFRTLKNVPMLSNIIGGFRTFTPLLHSIGGLGKSLSSHRTIHFVCNSWIYPQKHYSYDRVFFTNKALLPSETPEPLGKYREEELANLRGDGVGTVHREEWDRIYDYAYYNDLGDPDSGDSTMSRKVLGGSIEHPYPRRVRTGRPATHKEPESESRLPLLKELGIYVPRDEMFGHLKMTDFLGNTIMGIVRELAAIARNVHEFNTFEDVVKLFKGEKSLGLDNFTSNLPDEISLKVVKTNHKGFLKFPMPQVIKEDESAWRTDEEFAREMLAGVNPVVIRRLQEFPGGSQLNLKLTKNHLDGYTAEEAITNKKLFILDHHGTIMPYLRRINATSTKTYATRTFLFQKDDGTLKPLAIELSLPHPDGDEFGEITEVYTPAEHGVEGSIWQLAKAYVAVNDSGIHQLISHWLNTHAAMEPFIIATNRQLSSLHPIYRLLHPHFRDTMYINALARQVLVNAGGIIESTFFPHKYAMEMSSACYKNWVFPDQALPADLIKRGMAVEDLKSPHGVRLLIEDYPYAVDGLEIWSAIKKWVEDYCTFYYETDNMVQTDLELHSWWKEVVTEGHGDKKDELWWPKMNTISELTETCTTIIWIASALHAAVNFGQYPYAGYPPNRPTLSRKFMPEPGSTDYERLKTDPVKVFLETITDQWKSIRVLSIIETLSSHSSDEVYLGKPTTPEWTGDIGPKDAFEEFGEKLKEIESNITARNNDKKMKNRAGLAKVSYTLLYPSSEGGTGMGIPNSVSI